MREQIRDKGRLEHILGAIDNVFEFMKDVDFESFMSNKLLKFGVIKNIEIIGEATYKLSKEFKEKHTEINWDVIIKMRHVLVHGYYKIRDEIAWDIIQKDLQPLKEQIQNLYNNYTE